MSNCFLSRKKGSSCGGSRGQTDVIQLLDCEADVNKHLATYNLSRELLTEYQLILARAGLFDFSEAQIRHVLNNLDVKSVLILIDWAMQFLQMKYREKQTDWFGKRGLSWHISSVVSKSEDGVTEVVAYAHLFDSCTQDWFAVVSIIEHLLSFIKKERLSLERVFYVQTKLDVIITIN